MSLQSLHRSLGLSYEEERRRLKEEAIDDALQKVDGDLMTNVVMNYSYYYIPYIYGQGRYVVEGDVWKKQTTDIGAKIDKDAIIYTAIEENGQVNLIENINN